MPSELQGPAKGHARRSRRTRWMVVGVEAVVATLGVGVAAWPGLVAEHDRRAEFMPGVRRQVDYATTAAAGHEVYLPRAWTHDLSTYPGYATFLPEGGLYSSGQLGDLWLLVTQFDAAAITAEDAGISTTPETLCEPTGPEGVEARNPHSPAKAARTYRSYCYAVPGHRARIRIQVWKRAAGLDPSLDLAVALPEDGRMLDVAASGRAVPVDDPAAWAADFIEGLAEFDPSAYSAEDVYQAERAAGHFNDA